MTGRGPGLGGVLGLAAISAVASAAQAWLLILLPFALLLVAMPPHRPWRWVVGAAVAVGLLAGARVPLADFGRGWALVLAAWFVLASVLAPQRRFLPRGLFAVAATVATVAIFLAANPGSFTTMDEAARLRLEEGVSAFLALRGGEAPAAGFEQAVEQSLQLQSMLYPSLLAVASLSGLGVAWWLFTRLAGPAADAEGSGLAPLREFRFADGLVWVLILGLIAVLTPGAAMVERAGANVLLFMAALYVLRGLAVMVAVLANAGTPALVLATIAAVLLYPLTLVVGLSDMWLDLRSRWRAVAPPGS